MNSKAIPNPRTLKDYLGSRDLTEHLKLTKELSFHWSNWDLTCLAQRKHYKNFNNNHHLTRLNQTLQELKNKPVWLCNKVRVIRTDLYSLYESYLDSRLRLTWFERKDEILFSYEGEQGPYFTLTSMKWLDKDIYSQFVLRKILIEHYTLRSFRLNAIIPLHFKLDNDVNIYENKVVIHQMSDVGFIFKIMDKNFLNKMKNSHMMELKIPIAPFIKTELMSLEDTFMRIDQHEINIPGDAMTYRLDARILNYYGNLNNAKRSTEDEFYIFARYEDLMPFDHDTELKNVFAPLVEKTKRHFLADLDELESIRKAKMQEYKKSA